MRMSKLILLLLAVLPGAFCVAQNVGIGTVNPHPSAQLEIQSTTKGTLITTMTTAQRKAIASPALGLLVFDTDKKTIYMFDGSRWLPFLFSTTEVNPPSYVIPSPSLSNAQFGYKVDIEGDYAIIGAPQAAAFDVGFVQSGCAYIFHKVNSVWVQQDLLLPSDPEAGQEFGASVCINNSYAFVGSPNDDIDADANQGSVYVFSRVGEDWSQQSKITTPDGLANDFFGCAIDVNPSNNIVIGAYGDNIAANLDQGSVYLYQGSAGFGGFIWSQEAKLTSSDGATGDFFGSSVSIFNNFIAVGAYGDDILANTDQGSVYTYFKFTNPAGWTSGQAHIDKVIAIDGAANDYFGISVHVTFNYLAVGASGDDIGANTDQGSVYLNSAPNPGLPVYAGQTKILAPDGLANDNFGVSLSADATVLVVGAYRSGDEGPYQNKGAAYVFKSPGIISLYPNLFFRKINDDTGQDNGYFGFAVSVSNFEVVIGAYGKNTNNGQIAFINVE